LLGLKSLPRTTFSTWLFLLIYIAFFTQFFKPNIKFEAKLVKTCWGIAILDIL
jgi:hypothetical protein